MAFVLNVHAQYGQYSSRSLLEKKIYYLADGKIQSARFWSLYLGDHDCKVFKYFPGEGDIELNATVNYSLLSSGYIEGKGYSSRGGVTSEALFGIARSDTVKTLPLDSIEYVYSYGEKVKPVGEEETDLILYSGGKNRLTVRRLTLRLFSYDKQYGELKHTTDIPIQAFAFSREAAAKAASKMKGMQ
jgi:hypothetical protein